MGSAEERSSGSSMVSNSREKTAHLEPTRKLQALYDHGDQPKGIVASTNGKKKHYMTSKKENVPDYICNVLFFLSAQSLERNNYVVITVANNLRYLLFCLVFYNFRFQ